MYYEDFFIKIARGGIVRMCRTVNIIWDRQLRCCEQITSVWLTPVYKRAWSLQLLYYIPRDFQNSKGQVQHLQRLFYTAGVMSRTRGLHFNYCKRWRNYHN